VSEKKLWPCCEHCILDDVHEDLYGQQLLDNHELPCGTEGCQVENAMAPHWFDDWLEQEVVLDGEV
jgi:hypothetical protein